MLPLIPLPAYRVTTSNGFSLVIDEYRSETHSLSGCYFSFRRARNYYKYAISRERAATRLACFWRCVAAIAETTRRRDSLRIALVVNPLIRGFLGRLVVRAVRKENHQNRRATLVVSWICRPCGTLETGCPVCFRKTLSSFRCCIATIRIRSTGLNTDVSFSGCNAVDNSPPQPTVTH